MRKCQQTCYCTTVCTTSSTGRQVVCCPPAFLQQVRQLLGRHSDFLHQSPERVFSLNIASVQLLEAHFETGTQNFFSYICYRPTFQVLVAHLHYPPNAKPGQADYTTNRLQDYPTTCDASLPLPARALEWALLSARCPTPFDSQLDISQEILLDRRLPQGFSGEQLEFANRTLSLASVLKKPFVQFWVGVGLCP